MTSKIGSPLKQLKYITNHFQRTSLIAMVAKAAHTPYNEGAQELLNQIIRFRTSVGFSDILPNKQSHQLKIQEKPEQWLNAVKTNQELICDLFKHSVLSPEKRNDREGYSAAFEE